MTATEKNDHYAKLCARFDSRSAFLAANEFEYVRLEELDMAVWTRKRHGKVKTFAAGFVMNADEIVWSDVIGEVNRFVGG